MDSGQNNSKWRWLWHRLRAMGPEEVVGRARKIIYQRRDRKLPADWSGFEWGSAPLGAFPRLPAREAASDRLRESVVREAARVANGTWRGFGWLDMEVGASVDWFRDHLAGISVNGDASSFELNHRRLPEGADVKLLWELSRWGALSRLAQGAYLGKNVDDGRRVLDLLESWIEANPAFRGWNWTSALESGFRLIQYAWIEALLIATLEDAQDLSRVEWIRRRLMGPHVLYTKRYLSIGSSANNHLLGELAGLIVARVRWPGTSHWLGAVAPWRRRLEMEILKQFAPDGGNREQALNYQVFSFELCWHAALALESSGESLGAAARERLALAGAFYRTVQVPSDPWDYGDSDSAFVAPFLFNEARAASEWFAWFGGEGEGEALRFWLGAPPPGAAGASDSEVWTASETGIARFQRDGWDLRFDVSPLGYLKTAAHGHLDALHLSVWVDGVALVIDPGTGAYYGDRDLRTRLASRSAHNGPDWEGGALAERLGPFLWGRSHQTPTWTMDGARITGELRVGSGNLRREILPGDDGSGWVVQDCVAGNGEPLTCRWSFAPGTTLVAEEERWGVIERQGTRVRVTWEGGWEMDRWLVDQELPAEGNESPGGNPCSSAFRRLEQSLGLVLRGRADGRAHALRLERVS